MTTRLLLLRHAESEWNALGRWHGRADPPLSDRGRRRVATAAERLRGLVGSIWASPLQRAAETAGIIASALALGPVSVDRDLQEWDAGEWTGLTSAEIEERYPREFSEWRNGTLRRYPGGSDRTTHHETVIGALQRLVESCADDRLLVVTHAGSIGSIERHLGVHPGRSIRQLEGRWFELGSDLAVVSDRVLFADECA